ncbi:DNJC4 protein, partial [Polyodon spathula]|nr:DNJC4 protein [Polyodon spathula]
MRLITLLCVCLCMSVCVLQLHPDSDPSNPSLHSRFVALSEAYQVLSKESSRRQYDATLRLRPASGSGSRGDPYTYPSSHSPG